MSEHVTDQAGKPTLSPLVWEGDRAPLAKALVEAQKATESIKKAATNPAFRSKYADLAHVVEGVVPALNAAGVAVLQSPASDGAMVSVTTVLLHESGASVEGTLSMRPTKNDPQGVGSAITYARRYALLAMTGAAPEDDDGNAASKAAPANGRQDPNSRATLKRSGVFEGLRDEVDACNSVAELMEWGQTNANRCAELPAAWRDALRDRFQVRKEELEGAAGVEEADAEMTRAYRGTVAA